MYLEQSTTVHYNVDKVRVQLLNSNTATVFLNATGYLMHNRLPYVVEGFTFQQEILGCFITLPAQQAPFCGKQHLHVVYRKPIFRAGQGNTLKYIGKYAMPTSRSQSVNILKQAILRIFEGQNIPHNCILYV